MMDIARALSMPLPVIGRQWTSTEFYELLACVRALRGEVHALRANFEGIATSQCSQCGNRQISIQNEILCTCQWPFPSADAPPIASAGVDT